MKFVRAGSTATRDAYAVTEGANEEQMRTFGTAAHGALWSVASQQLQSATSPFQEFVGDSDALETARAAQRALVLATDPSVRDGYYNEHRRLVEKHFLEGLSPKEQGRLTYVGWQLERFEDAEIGPRLDKLERLAAIHRAIAEDVAEFADHAVTVATQRGRQRVR
jgi:hypothetical protein